MMSNSSDDFELWEEHLPVVELFMRCIRQWRVVGESFLGIDYSTVEIVARLMGIGLTLDLFDDFQIMEARAVERLNKSNDKKTKRKGSR